MPKKYDLILVDGSSYLFRAFHALPPLVSKQGEPTGAIYGVLNMLKKLREHYQPQHLAVVFDAKGPTFRNDIYSEYKANRPPMPDELRSQIEPLHSIIKAQGWPLISVSGVEADDVIGTLCKQASQAGINTLVSTGDKDLAQLVNEHVSLINTMNDQLLDPEGVVAKFGVPPEQIIDYLALMGDTSDNVPGIPKVGPKTAVKLLVAHGSLDGVVAAADTVKGKLGENIRGALEQLPISKDLVTIRDELELDVAPADLNANEPDEVALRDWYTRFGFHQLLAGLESGGEVSGGSAAAEQQVEAPRNCEYDCVTERDVFLSWLEQLKQADEFAFDTETTSLDYMQAKIVGVSFAGEPGKAAYVPLTHDYPGAPDQLDYEFVMGELKPLLEDPAKGKIGQHLKYDAHVLRCAGIELRGIAADTMLESYVFNSTATRHDMDSLAKFYLDQKTTKFEEVAGKGAKQLTFNQVDLETASDYAAEDADITLQLHNVLGARLEGLPTVAKVYNDIELPLVPVLTDIEHTGVLIDRQTLAEQSHELATRMQELEQLAHDAAGQPFNLGSPKQLQEILYEKQGIPIIRKTPKGAPSTAEDVLQELAAEHELPKLILEHRSLSKLKSTYTDKLPKQIDPDTGRVHTSYHQAVAATGRLSSSDPNLQNIPIRTAEGRRIREAFIAPEGKLLLAADYSQIELRIMAHLSDDEGLKTAFSEGIDVHQATAAEVFAVGLDEVSADQRRSAKAINFGLIYGMSAFGLAKQLHIGRTEAQDYIDLYFARYPGVKRFMDNTRTDAANNGYVQTVLGRRFYLPEIDSRNAQRRQHAERTAINAPMQGTAADIIKLAMINVHGWLAESKAPARIIMQVHDELVLEVDESAIDEIKPEIEQRMTNAMQLNVPLEVESGQGLNWEQAH